MKRVLMTLALAAATLFTTAAAHAQVGVAVRVGPAAVYAAPYPGPYPGPGYVWTDGYYAGTIWVPGRWAYRGGYYHPYARPYYAHPYYGHPYYRGYGYRR